MHLPIDPYQDREVMAFNPFFASLSAGDRTQHGKNLTASA